MKWWLYVGLALFGFLVTAGTAVGIAVMILYPRLPNLSALQDYKPVMPLQIYTVDNDLIGVFGQERREFMRIESVPKKMKEAILAAEDERFYSHSGVDYLGILRALYSNLRSGQTVSGASTITQQVAKNFFLTPERTLARKFKEALLAFKIEKLLTKPQILELYVNQINLGQRAYGFAAAAHIYFGKNLDALSVAEVAMLAGLPKAPSRHNPVVNPDRAKLRQRYVLRRMHELNMIDRATFQDALTEPLQVRQSQTAFAANAEFVAEMVRQFMVDEFNENAYKQGYKVYTTLRTADQNTAYLAVRHGLLDYDRRHGYRGAEAYVDVSDANPEHLDAALNEVRDSGDIYPAVVLQADEKTVSVYIKGGEWATITGSGLQFAQRMLSPRASSTAQIRRGAVVRLKKNTSTQAWDIVQLPQVESAFVAVDPKTGAVRALVGGFDFSRNRFNHAIQAWRQPGSGFKPFIYSAALEKGVTAATIVNDTPLVFEQNGKRWEPRNDDSKFLGPITVRYALARSRNMASIRILQAITPQFAQKHIQKFGFLPNHHPPYLPLALGAGVVTPYQMAHAYTVFANGGYQVQNYYIDRIEDAQGRVIFRSKPAVAGRNAPFAIDPRNAYLINSLLMDVVRSGTASRALALGRLDLAGKTGTTNNAVDAWFSGYSVGNLVAVVWVGYDQPRSLGTHEYGSQSALPIWMNYMAKVLRGVPENVLPMPEKMRTIGNEVYYEEYTDSSPLEDGLDADPGSAATGDAVKELLF